MTTPTHDPQVLPGESFPVGAADLCAVRGCGGSADRLGQLEARLHGGYSRPAEEVTLQLPLCFDHAVMAHDGLTAKSWTPPMLG